MDQLLPDGYEGMGETVEPGCGDIMRIYIRTHREIITEIKYTLTESSCDTVRSCAAAAIALAKDKPVMEAYLITKDQIADCLGILSIEQIHCAMMAELTLKKAIVDYARRRREKLAM